MVMLVVLCVFLSILSIISLTYYYYYFCYSYFLILILEHLTTINDIESAKAIGIKPGQKLLQMTMNSQGYESPEEIANNDPKYDFPKGLCRENVNQSGGLLAGPILEG